MNHGTNVSQRKLRGIQLAFADKGFPLSRLLLVFSEFGGQRQRRLAGQNCLPAFERRLNGGGK